MGHHHKHHECRRTKCKHKEFKDENIKIIITKSGRAPRWRFCDQIKAFPLTHRKCA